MFDKSVLRIFSTIYLLSFLCCKPKSVNDQVNMFRNDSIHSGIYFSSGITRKPSIKWEYKTSAPITSSAAVSGNLVYFGSGDGFLYCLNNLNGKLIWKFKTGGAVNSTPAVFDGKVFFGSYDGYFYALNSENGRPQWRFSTNGEKRFAAKGLNGALPKDSVFQDSWDFFLSSPLISEGIVYFGSGTGWFYALDTKTGKEFWKFKTEGVIHASPVTAFGNVYFGSWDTYMYALNKKSGDLKWKFKTGIDTVIYNQTGMQGSPIIDGDVLYFGCRDSHLYALNAKSGKYLWKRFNDYSWVSSTPAIHGNKIIYTTGDGHCLVALNKTNGDSIYQIPSKGWIFSSPSVAGNTVLYGDLNGFLYSNDIETGRQIWIYQLSSSKKDIYKLLNRDSTLNTAVAFSKQKLKQEGKSSMEMIFSLGSIHSSPVISKGMIYFGSTNGSFYAMQ